LDKALQSAPFKRDYVTFFAVVLLVLAIASELLLILWLPVQLRSEYLWDEEVARQKMVMQEDDLRGNFEKLSSKSVSSRQKEEIKLVIKQLDDLARYIRKYRMEMTRSQIMDIYDVLQDYSASCKYFEKNNQYSNEETIDAGPVLDRLFKPLAPVTESGRK